MIKTTRIKYSQSPKMKVDDLTPQCDGQKQRFILSEKIPEYAPYCLVFNGQLYTNTAYKTWFELDSTRKVITTSFPEAPSQGPDKSLIVLIGAAGMEDLEVDWDDLVKAEIQSWDAAVLAEAKAYADEKDAEVLSTAETTAKTYTDGKASDAEANAINSASAYADTAVAAALTEAKAYADTKSGDSTGASETYTDGKVADAITTAEAYTDTAIGNLATVATSGDYSDLSNTPNLATVATSGSYNDLSSKPTIPNIVVTDLDPGEGVPLEANNFIFVYQGGGQ